MANLIESIKDKKTTIPGVVILVVVIFLGIAMTKGICTFDQFWEKVIYLLGILAAIVGIKLTFTNSSKQEKGNVEEN